MNNFINTFLSKYKSYCLPSLLVLILSGTLLEENIKLSVNSFFSAPIPIILLSTTAILFLLHIPSVLYVLKVQRLRYVIIATAIMCLYIVIHSTGLEMSSFHLPFSTLLLLLLSATLYKENRVYVFSVLLLVILLITVLSPGIEKIFTLDREFGSAHRKREDILVGISGHYINYAMRCVMAAFISAGLFIYTKYKIMKITYGFITVTAFIAAATCGSRGAIIALLTGSSCFLLMTLSKANKQRLISPKFIIPCALIFLCMLPWNIIYQAFTMENSMSKRWWLLLQGWAMFRDNCFIGISWNNFYNSIHTSQHSNWTRTFVELGIIGAIGEMLIWYMFFRMAFIAKKMANVSSNIKLETSIISWTSIMASFFIWELFENVGLVGGTRLYFICFGVISALYLASRKQLLSNAWISEQVS